MVSTRLTHADLAEFIRVRLYIETELRCATAMHDAIVGHFHYVLEFQFNQPLYSHSLIMTLRFHIKTLVIMIML